MFFAARPETGRLSRWFYKRLKAKAKHPAFYYTPTIKARFNDRRVSGVTVDADAERKQWQKWLLVASVPVCLGLAGWGWYIMNYIAK